MPAGIPDGVPRVDGRALDRPEGTTALVEALISHRCCVVTDVAQACPAWSVLLSAAKALHGADAATRYRTWRRLHGTWRGYEPSPTDAEKIAQVVDVDPTFVSGAARREFSSFDIGPLWPVAATSESGGVIDRAQPWPELPGFVPTVTEAYLQALHFGKDIARRLLTSEPLAPSATVPPFDAPCSTLRLLRYDPGLASGDAHLDHELLTMVVADGPGLEVRDSQGQWRQPVFGEEDVVLMAGDMLQATTHRAVRAALHRVTSAAVRHSAVVFVAPDFETELPIPGVGKRMPFGQYFEGVLIRTIPHLWSSYEAGEITIPYPLPEPNPFKGEPAPRRL